MVSMANESKRNLKNELPSSVLSKKLKYFKLGFHYFISNALYFLLLPLICIVFTYLSNLTIDDFFHLWNKLRLNFVTALLCLVSLVLTSIIYLMNRPRKVYLVNFACYKPDPSHMCSKERLLQMATQSGIYTEEVLAIHEKILERSGIGSTSYVPKALMDNYVKSKNMAEARKETEAVIFGAIDELFAKTGVKPRDIGILVVNSSTFNPTPSLSAMVVNRYKLRCNISSYNLGGMGCSAGLISIDLAQRLLQVQPNSYALVVSTENIILNPYHGNERSMVISNCFFRMGGAAILLSNRSSDRSHSKYQLVQTLRTHTGADDKSYKSVFQQEDEFQNIGIRLSKDLTAIIGEALKTHITSLGPLVVPMSEKLLFFATLVARKIFKMKIRPYVPDFKLAFEHFCIHTGGKPVLDEVEKKLELHECDLEPSRMTLYRFGNTSSSSVWYVLAYSEAKGRILKGDKIWQVAFGSGFKCSTVVWRALRTVDPAYEKNPWMDEIDHFPIQLPKLPPYAFYLLPSRSDSLCQL